MLYVRRHAMPDVPVEIADDVELWARQYGRHATLKFLPLLIQDGRVVRGAWVVRLTLRSTDKRMQLYQLGVVAEPPTEDVWLVTPNPKEGQPIAGTELREPAVLGLNITQMGAGGVRQFLEKGDTWSGRGQYRSLEEQVRQVRAANAATREKFRADLKEESRLEQRDKRRWRLKIPFIPVSWIGREAHPERTL